MKSYEYATDEALRCAALFRFGRDVEAALSMVDLFEQIQLLLRQAPANAQEVWGQLLVSMFGCQERQDWLGLADTLQYELIGLLAAVQSGW